MKSSCRAFERATDERPVPIPLKCESRFNGTTPRKSSRVKRAFLKQGDQPQADYVGRGKIRTLPRAGDMRVPDHRTERPEAAGQLEEKRRLVDELHHEFAFTQVFRPRHHIGKEERAGAGLVVEPGPGDPQAELVRGPAGHHAQGGEARAEVGVDRLGMRIGMSQLKVADDAGVVDVRMLVPKPLVGEKVEAGCAVFGGEVGRVELPVWYQPPMPTLPGFLLSPTRQEYPASPMWSL